ncbi:hypothetical protein PHMEG_00041496 [Phytophthora megakarya]|uniref:Uncharacterized protein n=1 Tax=Phytophthora megakarya TaxID=4795 RepID=A0A225UBM8_9STRA|nr:hypothetical protein PHMEG_00041496 [Phytophthora megakarya]
MGKPGAKLFSPVYVKANNAFRHGQITAYDSGTYSVQTNGAVYTVPLNEPVVIAPVVAILLWRAELPPSIYSATEIEAAHTTILDRLFGNNGIRATKAISRLLEGIVAAGSMPKRADMVPWRCPRSGHPKRVNVADVINFAHHVDGGRAAPSSVQMGDTWIDGPATQAVNPTTQADERTTVPNRRDRTTFSGPNTADPQIVDPPSIASSDDSESEETSRFSDLLNALILQA